MDQLEHIASSYGARHTWARMVSIAGGVLVASALLVVTAASAAQTLTSLKAVTVPTPANLGDFVRDKSAAIQLGKALFWDMQVSSDGTQACASCHWHAGADTRITSVVNSGFDKTLQVASRANHTLQLSDFPFHKLADVNNRDSAVQSDSDDAVGSQALAKQTFVSIDSNGGNDKCTLGQAATAARPASGRNTPTVINAVFNDRLAWIGQFQSEFNGVNAFGDRDATARVWKLVNGVPTKVHISIPNAALASLAVGVPPGPNMSCAGRKFIHIGKKMLNPNLVPLGKQVVSPTDSVLGSIASSQADAKAAGLQRSYAELITQAFRPEWASTTLIPNTSNSQMQANFSLFFGLAVQLYQATLVSDQAPIDQFLAGNGKALTNEQQQGLGLFLSGKTNCSTCHLGSEFTKASVGSIQANGSIERMRQGDGAVAVYDTGFYRIGVRPAKEDLGLGGCLKAACSDPTNLGPLSRSRFLEQQVAKDPSLVIPVSGNAKGVPGNGQGALKPNEPVAVDGRFKTPDLRNVELTGPYFHDGGQATLRQVVDFYNRGGDFPELGVSNLDPNIKPLGLSEAEKNALVAFLLSLTDERVRFERAPFDHPAIALPNGMRQVNGATTESQMCIPAVGASGATAPLTPFLNADQFQAMSSAANVPPTVQVDGVSTAGTTSNPANVTIKATSTAPLLSIGYRIDGGPLTCAAATGTSAFVPVSVSGAGEHTVTFFASDTSANTTAGSTTVVILSDQP